MSETKHTYEYDVTEDGRVFSLTSNWRGYGRREMRRTLNACGYLSVRMIIDGKRKRIPVHRLIANKYLPPRPTEHHQIRHLDGDKMNNSYKNLAWGTAKDNAVDREIHGRTARGLKLSRAVKASNQAEGTRAFRRRQREERANV